MSHEAQSLSPRKALKRRAVSEVGEAPVLPLLLNDAAADAGVSALGHEDLGQAVLALLAVHVAVDHQDAAGVSLDLAGVA